MEAEAEKLKVLQSEVEKQMHMGDSNSGLIPVSYDQPVRTKIEVRTLVRLKLECSNRSVRTIRNGRRVNICLISAWYQLRPVPNVRRKS